MSPYLERRTVSRKTPRDGKLEISGDAARALLPMGERLNVDWAGDSAPARIVAMSCTCGGGESDHEHFFVQSELLRGMDPESMVDLSVDEASGRLTVTLAR
jgi:hypothetical protein